MTTNQLTKDALVGGFEAGGTKFNCALGYRSGEIIARKTFPTTSPQETLARVSDFFEQSIFVHGPIQALGIAHFGPIEINKASENYGKVLATTKPEWSYTDIVDYFSAIYDVPIAFQSDVNVAAVGEHYYGAAKGIDNFVYITVGTGIGGGVFVNGQLLNNLRHPEIGHMLVPQDITQDSFKGCCTFHGNCLEGLASGPAIKSRWGVAAEKLGVEHVAWELEAHYLAILCINLSCCYSPEKIIFGGGVMQQKQLFIMIRKKFLSLMQGYMATRNNYTIEDYIVQSPLAGDAAIMGSLVLAQQAYDSNNNFITLSREQNDAAN